MRGRHTIGLAIGVFVMGVTAQKYHYLPHDSLRHVEMQIRAWGVQPDTLLSGQYSRDRETLPAVKDIDTALLPLRIRRARISDVFPIPKTAGAIATIGNTVIVVDRLGNLYSSVSDGRTITQLPFPPLPNDSADYLKTPGARLDANTFRAHDIEYMKAAKSLAVCHEYFDAHVGKTRLAVSIISIDEQSVRPTGSWRTVFLADVEPDGPNVESGGRLASKGDLLYLTVGAYMVRSSNVAQNAKSSFGKIIEIDLGTGKSKIVSVGHRNPQGLLITRSGELLSTEHGPAGGDELNLIAEGANYGWPNVTLGTDYGAYDWSESKLLGEHKGYQAPMFAWVPSVGISNLIQVERFNRRWDGDLLIGSLKAESVFRVRLNDMRIMYVEPIWIGQRIRDIGQLENGTIVLWTDDTQLLFISVDGPKLETDVRPAKLTDSALNDACMYCHHFGPTNVADFAPTLSDLFSRKIASDDFRFSAGLRNKEGVWTDEALRQFLHSPAKFANGTAMPTPNLDEDQFDEVIEALKRNGDSPGLDATRDAARRVARSPLASHASPSVSRSH
jgi:cytochrome c2